LKGAKKGCPTYPQGSPDEVGSHITRRFMVVKRRTMNTATRQFVPKKNAQEEKTALKLGIRKDRPPGHGGPDAKRAKPPICSKKEGCPKGRSQPPNILRQNSCFGVGLKRPNHKRANRQFVPKKKGG